MHFVLSFRQLRYDHLAQRRCAEDQVEAAIRQQEDRVVREPRHDWYA